MPNVLALAIFVYDLISKWAFGNTVLLLFTGGLGNNFLLRYFVGPILSAGIIYALCAGIMKGHRDTVWDQMDRAQQARERAAQEAAAAAAAQMQPTPPGRR